MSEPWFLFNVKVFFILQIMTVKCRLFGMCRFEEQASLLLVYKLRSGPVAHDVIFSTSNTGDLGMLLLEVERTCRVLCLGSPVFYKW